MIKSYINNAFKFFFDIFQFLKDSYNELYWVKYPTLSEVLIYCFFVILVGFLTIIIFYPIDLFFMKIINYCLFYLARII